MAKTMKYKIQYMIQQLTPVAVASKNKMIQILMT